jgi:hypothetical protein
MSSVLESRKVYKNARNIRGELINKIIHYLDILDEGVHEVCRLGL